MQKQPAKQFMATRLITLTSEMDVFESIGYLLKHRISGAPVIGSDRQFLGVFSEKTSMRVLIESAYDQLPTCRVGAFMNTDPKRVISEDADLLAVMKIFLDTPYRRLPVLRDGHLIGQVSRRDALRAQDQVAQNMSQHEKDHAILQLSHAADHGAPDGESQPGELAVPEVADFMDRKASTIDPETDLFSIAHLFLNTPYRRLPVLDEGKLVGQVNRHDLLQAAHEVMAVPRPPERNLLYLSSLVDRSEAPL
jgi:CBS domain-containing protein